jgi:hypothetical protein
MNCQDLTAATPGNPAIATDMAACGATAPRQLCHLHSLMNIHLPAGKWIDIENGTVHTGPITLTDFNMCGFAI